MAPGLALLLQTRADKIMVLIRLLEENWLEMNTYSSEERETMVGKMYF